MGSVIPIPEFPVSMTAILCVRIGNRYGVSNAAQGYATEILKKTTQDRWIYFFEECFQSNDRLLYKLLQDNPLNRWIGTFSGGFIDAILPEIKKRDVINILKFTKDKNIEKIRNVAKRMYTKIGYKNS